MAREDGMGGGLPKKKAKKSVSKTKDKKTYSKEKPFYVFVDCLPREGADVSLDEWAGPFEKEVGENSQKYTDDGKPTKIAHYNALPFGLGKTAVLNLMTADLLQGKEWQSIFVSSRHALSAPIVSLLSNFPNAMVIRGLR